MCCDIQDYLKYRCHLSDMENNMRKYIPLVLFIFSWPVLSADIYGQVVRVLGQQESLCRNLRFE
ncbi:hypothetical protein AC18_5193 [Escherichia coli 2-222-05_S3_C2]|nr:hypothetical protein [Salmonella enterica subsp. enterica serovar Virchow]ECH9486100.1 hypothetical protein [Salmonella enterica subsp. enterica]EEV3471929.1 hypothetical protein [Escherichia coli]EFW2042916.1 hypothetical protein [Shigella flexneri]KDX82875.1 hypothetical protein AC46_5050 [Escherichia coli 2-222-05_S3_C3]KEN90227.1 hypothetical protein AB88_2355 [Escherichia coli 2-222-05_S3_C1]KEN92785.1 hypothetical protein AC18_5193 [Escherichia coli 2-222-05_S3_C2]